MRELLAIVLGACVGASLFLLYRSFAPARLTLAGELDEIHAAARRRPSAAPQLTASSGPLTHRLQLVRWLLGDKLARTFIVRGWLGAGMRSDLAIIGRTPAEHFARKIVGGIVGLLIFPTLFLILGLVGIHLPILVPLWGALIAAATGFPGPPGRGRTPRRR